MSDFVQPLVYRPGRWSLEIKVQPAIEPIDEDTLSLHLRADDSEDSLLLLGYIAAARGIVEGHTKRALLTQTRVMKLDRFPGARHQVIELPGGVVQGIVSVSYIDENGASQTWGSSNYATDFGTRHGTGRLGLATNAEWPDTIDDGLAVTVTYLCGWTSAALVPAEIRQAVLMVAADLYDRRHASAEGAIAPNPAVAALLGQWRITRVG